MGRWLVARIVLIAACLATCSGLVGCSWVTVSDPAVPAYNSVRQLAEASSLVVVGKPQSQTVVPASGHVGDYTLTVFSVETVLSQSAGFSVGDTVMVRQPVSHPEAEQPPTLATDVRYLLYLTSDTGGNSSSSVFYVVGPAAGQWAADDPGDPTVFTPVAPDPRDNLPSSITAATALG